MDIVGFEDIPPMKGIDTTIKFMFPKDVGMIFAVLRLRNGQKFPEHFHKVCEEVYYVTEGRGVITIGDESREIRKGDAVLIRPNNYHTIQNVSSELLELVAVRTPYLVGDSYMRDGNRDKGWRKTLNEYIDEVDKVTHG
jgi:mannose-6-phosphate isomerase-like protein (cupin superfamily)